MEKRLILAIVLSSFILLLWSLFTPKPAHKPDMTVVVKPQQVTQPEEKVVSDEKSEPPASFVKFANDKLEAVFDENRAAIKEVVFKQYHAYKFSLFAGLSDGTGFKQAGIDAGSITFKSSDGLKEVTKRFIFSNSNYSIELEILSKNLSNAPLNLSSPLTLGAIDLTVRSAQARDFDFSVFTQDKLVHPNPQKENVYNNFKFIGLRDRYFCIITAAPNGTSSAFIKKDGNKRSLIGFNPPELLAGPGQTTKDKFLIYLGPQEIKSINAVHADWSAIVNFGTFDIISQVLLKLLEIFYGLSRNWGLAIIILSIAVYFLLYPLSVKQMRSMKEMQALQPRIEELRKIHKDNPQKLNKEIMELYREHKVNPLGGCLPLLLQMPIFFALYQALLRSISLKGATFLWIKDLSEPDRLFILPTSLPVLGNAVNLLPILMMIGMFMQQKLTMSAAASGNSEQQKIMLIVFPLLFGFIFYNMPSGLVLYWFINSALMLTFQFKVNRSK